MPRLSRASYLLAAPVWVLGCAPDARTSAELRTPSGDDAAEHVPTAPRELVLEQVLPPRDPPPAVCALGCPAAFRLELESRTPWPPGTYFLRVAQDGGGPQVCSVVFEPVFGAAHDDCRDSNLPVDVAYRYDGEVRRIDRVELWSVQHDVHIELLTAEAAPRLVDVRHELVWLPPTGCASCQSALPLTVSVLETWASPPDAGAAHAANADVDAGPPADAGAP